MIDPMTDAMTVDEGPSDDVAAAEEAAVLAYLVRQREPGTALGIARSTGLSTLVVVPALERLSAAGAVARQVDVGGDRPRLVYQLTPLGRRDAARGRRPLRSTVPTRTVAGR